MVTAQLQKPGNMQLQKQHPQTGQGRHTACCGIFHRKVTIRSLSLILSIIITQQQVQQQHGIAKQKH